PRSALGPRIFWLSTSSSPESRESKPAMSRSNVTFRNRSGQLARRAPLRPWKTKCHPGQGALGPAHPVPENFFQVREREGLTRPRHSSSPLNYSLLPNENSIAQFKKQSHHCGEEGCHDNERGENFAVFGPALGPTEIPTETGFNSYRFRYHQS